MLGVNKPNNVIHYDWAVGFKINEMLVFRFLKCIVFVFKQIYRNAYV
jgi:hypothetical protein